MKIRLNSLVANLLASSSLFVAGQALAIAPPPVAPTGQVVTFSVHMPLTNAAAMKTALTALQTPGSPTYKQFITPAQFDARYGPTAATMTAATQALTAAGLQVVSVQGRSIQVTGTVAQANTLLHVTLRNMTGNGGALRAVSITPPIIPANSPLAGAVIPAFAPIPDVKANSRVVPVTDNRRSPEGGYYYDDLKEAYDYPAYNSPIPGGGSLDGTGVKVAILGVSTPLNSDVKAMFTNESFTTQTGKTAPKFTVASVDGGAAPYGGVNDGGTDEASLDVQQVLGGAPGAKVTFVGIPGSNQSFSDAYYDIVVANGGDGAFDIVSTSFGECELFYTRAYNNGLDFTYQLADQSATFAQGAMEGISFIFSSGDSGGLGCPSNEYFAVNGTTSAFQPGVESFADDPNVTAVGGTNLVTSYPVPYNGNPATPEPSTYVSENGQGDPEIPYDPYGVGLNVTGGYWGAGGGISAVFGKPSYQTLVNSGSSIYRTVPDVGMQVGGCPGGISVQPCGSPRSSVIVWIGGTRYGFIGTSVAAPEFAGALAVALQNARLVEGVPTGRAGNLNPYLYTQGAAQIAAGGSNAPAAKQFYHMNISGYDGYYSTSPSTGYNYITGNGTPDVRLLFGMSAYPAAGDPQTAGNP
jgi:subtilase family serine protease